MPDHLTQPVSDFVRVCEDLLIEPRPELSTHELDILEGYIHELTERFFGQS